MSFEDVQRDIEDGLGEFFAVEAVDFVDPTTPEQGAMTNGSDATAVRWVAHCRDTTTFPDLHPSGRAFTLEGVSFVRGSGAGAEISRVVDWNGAVAAFGESRNRRSAPPAAVDAFFATQQPPEPSGDEA